MQHAVVRADEQRLGPVLVRGEERGVVVVRIRAGVEDALGRHARERHAGVHDVAQPAATTSERRAGARLGRPLAAQVVQPRLGNHVRIVGCRRRAGRQTQCVLDTRVQAGRPSELAGSEHRRRSRRVVSDEDLASRRVALVELACRTDRLACRVHPGRARGRTEGHRGGAGGQRDGVGDQVAAPVGGVELRLVDQAARRGEPLCRDRAAGDAVGLFGDVLEDLVERVQHLARRTRQEVVLRLALLRVGGVAFPVDIAVGRPGAGRLGRVTAEEGVAALGDVLEAAVLGCQVELVVAPRRRRRLVAVLVDVEPVGGQAHAGALLGRRSRPIRASDVVCVRPVGDAGHVVGGTVRTGVLVFHAPSRGVRRVRVARRARHAVAVGVRDRVVRFEAADHLGPPVEVRLVVGNAVAAFPVPLARSRRRVAGNGPVVVRVDVADADHVVLDAGMVGHAGHGRMRVVPGGVDGEAVLHRGRQ